MIENETKCFHIKFDKSLSQIEAEKELLDRVTNLCQEDYKASGREMCLFSNSDHGGGVICIAEKNVKESNAHSTSTIHFRLEIDSQQFEEVESVETLMIKLECHCNIKSEYGRVQSIKNKVGEFFFFEE